MKKDFSQGLDGMLQRMEQPTPSAETKTQAAAEQQPTGRRGRPQKETAGMYKRATFLMDRTLLQQLKAASYAETGRQGRKVTITEILDTAIREWLKKHFN